MPYTSPYLDASGMHIPTYDERMDALITGYKQIFGADVYLEPDSKDYQMLSMFAKSVDDLTACVVDTYASRDPNLASGNALDLLLTLNGVRRLPATYSTVTLVLTGAPGATLPSGMQARDEQGFLWRIPGAVELDVDGKAIVDATCLTAGAVLTPANTITQIHTPTSTWNTVTNPAPSIPGREIETDAAVRERRALSVSLPSRGVLDGLRAALSNLDGVTFSAVVENAGAQTDDRGLPAHSICAVVEGGADADIAKTLWLKKSPGVATYGTSSEVYTDDWGNANVMQFSRPAAVPVTVKVKLKKLPGWDETSMPDAIKQAVSDYIGTLGIGTELIVSTLYGIVFGACEGASPAFAVTDLKASTSTQSSTADAITASYSERLTCGVSNVSLQVVTA